MNKDIVKKRVLFFFFNMLVVLVFLLEVLNKSLMPGICEYGGYQCKNISSRLINYVVESQISDDIKREIVVYNEGENVSIDFNTSILNSVASNAVRKLQFYFYLLENGELDKEILEILEINVDKDQLDKGIVYKVPVGNVLKNVLISNLGVEIPVRYKLTGEVKGQIVCSLKEYGINSALLEINLEIKSNIMVVVPLMEKKEETVVSVPLVIQLIQGEIPEAFLGTSVLGEVEN